MLWSSTTDGWSPLSFFWKRYGHILRDDGNPPGFAGLTRTQGLEEARREEADGNKLNFAPPESASRVSPSTFKVAARNTLRATQKLGEQQLDS